MAVKSRRDEIQDIYKEYAGFYSLTGGMLLLAIGFFFGMVVFRGTDDGFGYVTNVYTEGISIFVTVLILDRLSDRRRKREQDQRDEQLREERRKSAQLQAISELRRAKTPEERQPVMDRMKAEGLLKDVDIFSVNLSEAKLAFVNLSRAGLQHANLTRASLYNANLSGARLEHANLSRANLYDAYLERASLYYANLERADLPGANLSGADLVDANLEGANLGRANLSGAKLEGANLERANLRGATFDEKTVLPDAKLIRDDENNHFIYDKLWTPETDMSRYTNPEHPDFWQPNRWKKGEAGQSPPSV